MKPKEKLVRDKMPDLCRSEPGRTLMRWRYAYSEEFPKFLANKLLEEVNELQKAFLDNHKSALIEELADVEEVIRAIKEYKSIPTRVVEAVRKGKLEERGGFTQGIIWDGNK